jgi:hypothetical protein
LHRFYDHYLPLSCLQFLELYSEGLAGSKYGFTMRDGGFRFDLRVASGLPSHPQATDPLLIEDPVNVLNNIGKSCYKVGAVQGAFVEALEKLKTIVVRHNSPQKPNNSSNKLLRNSWGKKNRTQPKELPSRAVIDGVEDLPVSAFSTQCDVSVNPAAGSVSQDEALENADAAVATVVTSVPSFVRMRVKDLSAKVARSEAAGVSATVSDEAELRQGVAAELSDTEGFLSGDPLTLLKELFYN